MPGLMARILSRRANGAPPTAPPAVAHPADPPTEIQPPASEQPTTAADAASTAAGSDAAADTPATGDAPTTTEAAPLDPSLPAGAEPPAPGAPSFRHRGAMRRRLRYLRRVRELAFRDLGGLVFDLHRFERERPDLVEAKLVGLRAIDSELRALEVALDDVREIEEIEEPGIAPCAHCGALRGTDAQFCPACGTSVDEPVAPPAEPAAEQQPPAA